MIRLSIIIPAYNVANYLDKCIKSCESQDISKDDYEIIIINDGSKDDTLTKANELACKYANIIVLDQENQGQSVARNKGITRARGNYIWFIDSDDYIEDNCLSSLLEEAEGYQADAYGFCLKAQNSVSGEYHLRKPMPLPLNKVLTGLYAAKNGFYPASVCTYFFYREFLIDKDLKFTAGITHQDVEFTNRAIPVTQKVVYTNHSPYYYVYNPDSTSKSKSPERKKKYVLDDIIIASLIRDYAIRQKDKNIIDLLISRSNSIVCGTLYRLKHDKENNVFLQETVSLAKEKGLYPMKHNMTTWKLSLLSYFLNCEWLLNK
jgi:glycosyltransferase involved in cell wall biosynthesis